MTIAFKYPFVPSLQNHGKGTKEALPVSAPGQKEGKFSVWAGEGRDPHHLWKSKVTSSPLCVGVSFS